MKFFISVNLKEVYGVYRLFVTTPFCRVDTNSLCGSKRYSCKDTRKKLPEKANSLLFLKSEHFNHSAFPKLDKACEAFV